jgi:hypothetical protein
MKKNKRKQRQEKIRQAQEVHSETKMLSQEQQLEERCHARERKRESYREAGLKESIIQKLLPQERWDILRVMTTAVKGGTT